MPNRKRADELFKRIVALPDYLCRSVYAQLYGMTENKMNEEELDCLEKCIKNNENIVNRKETTNG